MMAFNATDHSAGGIESTSQQEVPLAPIDRLPVEILGKIICYCALRPSAVPEDLLVLADVSRAWRHTALTTPRAWCNIQLHCEDDYDGLDDAREWLLRAGACEKDVSIHGEAVVPGTHLLCELLDLLEPHVATIRSLDLNVYCEDPAAMTQLLVPLSRPMPALRYLILRGRNLYGRVGDQIDYTNKPLLRAFYSSGLDTVLIPHSLQMQLRRVTLESSGPITLRSLNQTFSDAPSSGVLRGLIALVLVSRYTHNDDSEPVVETLQASELEVLGVFGPLASSTRFFRYISMPKLTTLVLNLGFSRYNLPEAVEWARALAGSAPPLLRALYLYGFEAEDESLAALLARLPLLETLVLSRMLLSGALLDALSTSGYAHGTRHVGWLCPRLRRVSSSGGRGPKNQVSRGTMEAFALARLAGYQCVAGDGPDELVYFERLSSNVKSAKETNELAGPEPQPIAELVEVRCNGFVLEGFGLFNSHERWEWVPAAGRHAFETSDWWATSFGEDFQVNF